MLNKKYSKIILNLIVFVAVLVLSTNTVLASGQYGQYGGETESGRVMVDKLVRHPKTGEYVDNLGLNDPKFSAESSVFFKIVVENTGNSLLNEINVTDFLPEHLQYISGGTYNTDTREVKFTFNDVAPGDRRNTILQAKVNSLSSLPAEKTILCPINKVVASSPQDGSDEDTAQLCIAKKPMVGNVAPKAGDPISLALGLGSLTTLVGGLKLNKKYS